MSKIALIKSSKVCPKCKEDKPLSDYNTGGKAAYCKPCMKTYRSEKNLNQKYWLKSQYGITLEDYNQMFADQCGCCAICGKHQIEERAKMNKALAVDHDHNTGKVRGLLCQACNTGIGKLQEDPELLRKAISYLEAHSE